MVDATCNVNPTYLTNLQIHAAVDLWNSFPEEFRKLHNFGQFKSLIANWNGKTANAVYAGSYPVDVCCYVCALLLLCYLYQQLLTAYWLLFTFSDNMCFEFLINLSILKLSFCC